MLQAYKTDQIRNIVIVGHGSTGKSTLFDAILVIGKHIEKIGNPAQGTLTSDYDEEEKERHMSIRSALGFVEIDGVKINVIDTPGMSDFIGEARAALQVAETAVLIIDSVDGIQIETEKAWRYLRENAIPTIVFVNKMDKERASYEIIEKIKAGMGNNVIPVSIPIGSADTLKGVIDLIEMKAKMPKPDGKDVTTTEIPADLKAFAEESRAKLVELAAEGDDELIEKFLEGAELTNDEIRRGIKNQLATAKIIPVIFGSAIKMVGITTLLTMIKDFAPSPPVGKEFKGINPNDESKEITIKAYTEGAFSAIVWKTYIDQYAGRFNYIKVITGELFPDSEFLNSTKNTKERASKLYTMVGNKQYEVPKLCAGDIGVIVKLEKTCTLDTLCDSKSPIKLPIVKLPQPVFSLAVESTKKGEEDKIAQVISKITDENPTITYVYNPETKQSVLSGMGEMQLNIILKTLKEKYKLDVITHEPRVAYRETITKKAEAQYKHKKQTGGHGQYGEVHLRAWPLERGAGFEFKDSIVGGVVPKQYIPGVEKGVRDALEEGVLARFPVVDIAVELFFGSYHDVDSSEMSFRIAARNCVKKVLESAGPILLEPIMEVDIHVDKEFMGDILNDITSRRGRVLGMGGSDETGSGISVVKALVPLAEMLRYAIDLRAMTSGKATFEMRFSHYDPISGRIAEKVIEERKKFFEEEANK
ncbi:MAG: elongation factor G [Spirochaetes bacterium]|nr:elongation factor G [Spirochaetota bacterium]